MEKSEVEKLLGIDQNLLNDVNVAWTNEKLYFLNLTDIATHKGWTRAGKQGNFPMFKKGDAMISICNHCGGGFVNIIEPTPKRISRKEAKDYLING